MRSEGSQESYGLSISNLRVSQSRSSELGMLAHLKIMQPLHKSVVTVVIVVTVVTKTSRELQNAALRTSQRLSNVSNCTFKKNWESKKKRIFHDFFWGCVIFLTTVTAVTFFSFFFLFFSFYNFFSTFWKSNLTHLTTDVMFSGPCFTFLAMFFFCDNSKTQIVTKLNNSNCDNLKTQIVTKLKKSSCHNSKTQFVTKLKNSNCD